MYVTDWFGADSREGLIWKKGREVGPQDLDEGKAVVRMVLEGVREGKAKESVQKGLYVYLSRVGVGGGGGLNKKAQRNFTFLNSKTSSIRELKM